MNQIVLFITSVSAIVISILSFFFSLWSNRQRARLDIEIKERSAEFEARMKSAFERAAFVRSEQMKQRELLQNALRVLQSLKSNFSRLITNRDALNAFDSMTVLNDISNARTALESAHDSLLGINVHEEISLLHKIKNGAAKAEAQLKAAIGNSEFLPVLTADLQSSFSVFRSEIDDAQIRIRDSIGDISHRLVEESFNYVSHPMD